MTEPPSLLYQRADPAQGSPVYRGRLRPGDQMAFGFGCLGSILCLPVAIMIAGLSTLLPSTVPPGLIAGGVGAAHLLTGLALGVWAKRWGYLIGVAVSAAIAGAAVLCVALLRPF